METPSDEELWWEEPTAICRYCGTTIDPDQEYCSRECEKKDSAWNW